jgi:hypothetical protein
MMIAVALLTLVNVPRADSAGITFRQVGLASQNFTQDGSGSICGVIFEGPLTPIREIFYFGNDVTLTHGFDILNLTHPTTLTFAVAFRDMTRLPVVTMDQVLALIESGNSMHSLSTSILDVGPSGAASASTNGTFPVGSLDSYSNVIQPGDMMTLDWIVLFQSPCDNQNATVDLYGQTQSFVLF